MLTALKRVRLAVRDPETGLRRYAALLGREPLEGSGGTAGGEAFRLENVALALEPSPAGEGAEGAAAGGEGLAGLVFRSAELGRFREAARARGLAPRAAEGVGGREVLALEATRGVPVSVEAEAREGGAVSAEAERPSPDSVRALDHVVIRTGDPEAARRLYAEGLGLRLALDRAFPDWGVRLLFFRVGGVTVELAATLGEGGAEEGAEREAPDRLWGLSWRVDDIAAARERLARAGLDVSAVRAGRKPGTRVVSVRNGTCGVPTLLIAPEPA